MPAPVVSRILRFSFQKGGNLIADPGPARLDPPIKPPLSLFPRRKPTPTAPAYFTMGQMIELGKRTLTMDRLYNVREGLSAG